MSMEQRILNMVNLLTKIKICQCPADYLNVVDEVLEMSNNPELSDQEKMTIMGEYLDKVDEIDKRSILLN